MTGRLIMTSPSCRLISISKPFVMKRHFFLSIFIVFTVLSNAQTNLYVNPDAPDNESADGTLVNPYNDIAATVQLVANAGGGNVIIIDGEYDLTGRKVLITTAATASGSVTIKPQSSFGVKIISRDQYGCFDFDTSSRHITLEGIELYGMTDQIDYWTIVARAFWGDETIPRNGGLAIILDGQYITIKDNYIHDWFQKAVEIRDGRYVVVEGNIIHDIATSSLTGGHGIMRQQKGIEFFDDDTPGVYRWDIRENMLFNVEQRIYSWIQTKGFIEMVIDEGKSILIDDPKDTDGIQEHMSARITNNVVAFGSIDHIRLKSTPNLEVSHNNVYADISGADGISDRTGDTETAQFTNFKCLNNAVQSLSDAFAIEIDNAIDQTINAGGIPEVSGNYTMTGKLKPSNATGITPLNEEQLFIDPAGGNFRLNPALNLPASAGVSSLVLDALDLKNASYGVTFEREGFEIDHLKLSQTIFDNIPGLNDGITDNETVFADYGTMSPDYHTITFDVVDGDWKTDTGSPDTQEFRLNEVYRTWYETVATTHLNNSGTQYERIRWGNSEVMQNQAFDPDWLLVSQITAESNTIINGHGNNFILDGDILIDFENVTPQDGEYFDLIQAGIITTNNSGSLFDRVLFEGFTPANYTLEIINIEGRQALRLNIISSTSIEENSPIKQKLKIIPNPAKHQFELHSTKALKNIQLYNIAGKEVTKDIVIKPDNYAYLINVTLLKSGIYILQADNTCIKLIIN